MQKNEVICLMMEEILRIYVQIEECIQVNGSTRDINMIRFTGYAKSKYFQGRILPGGVDLQSCKHGERNLLSARYIMEGKDEAGNECHIYIENNGYADENGIIRTKPVVVTDSNALGWMERDSVEGKLEGSITSENDMVVIHIHRCAKF